MAVGLSQSSLVPVASRSTFYPATPTATSRSERSDSIFIPSSMEKAEKRQIFACSACSHGHNCNVSLWDHEGFTVCIVHGGLNVMARAQICLRTARRDGVKNANSDTQMRAVNPGLIVYSAHWLQCAAASPLYSIELPSILTVAPSEHAVGGAGRGRAPKGALRSLRHTRAVLRARQQTNAKIQRAISAIMA